MTIYCSSIESSNFNLKLGERKPKQSRRQRWTLAALLPCCVTLSRTHTPAHRTSPWVLPGGGHTDQETILSPHAASPTPMRQQEPREPPVLPDSPGVSLVLCTPQEACPSSSLLFLFLHHIIETTAISHSGIRKWRSQTGDVAPLVECLPSIHEPRICSRHRINWA